MEYAAAGWSQWSVGDKEVLERVQRRALRMVSKLQGRTYEDRLAEVGMTIKFEEALHMSSQR